MKQITCFCALALMLLGAAGNASAQGTQRSDGKIISMYVHQHWSYNRPYAARTWTLEDWKSYLDGISKLGYNTVFIWAVMETMPLPPTPSDADFIKRMVDVIHYAHGLGMRVFFPICPNVTVKDNEEASKYTYEKRPFFYTDERVNPKDPLALGEFMKRTERLYRPLLELADGITVIDSDPGGWPNSTYMEFVYLVSQYRQMLDRIRPGIELYYWAHAGWEAYGRFYATGNFEVDKIETFREVISLLAKQNLEPWGVGSSLYPINDLLEPLGLLDRGLAIKYGGIEGEPTFPFTIYEAGEGFAYRAGKDAGARGIFGNAQTHCVQLPNTFAFARASRGLPAEKADYVIFADGLIRGQGELIVTAWELLNGVNHKAIPKTVNRLKSLQAGVFETGELRGLLFGDGHRFIGDLIDQLNVTYHLEELIAAIESNGVKKNSVKKKLGEFITVIDQWQTKHGYSNQWKWDKMNTSLRKLNLPKINSALDALNPVHDEGDTAFERVKKGYAQLESYSPKLIQALKESLADLN